MSLKILKDVVTSKAFYKSMMTREFARRLIQPLLFILVFVLYNFFGHNFNSIVTKSSANNENGNPRINIIKYTKLFMDDFYINFFPYNLFKDIETTNLKSGSEDKKIDDNVNYFASDSVNIFHVYRRVGFCKSVGQCDKNCCKQSKYPDVIFFHDVHSFKFISDKIIKSVYKSNYELTDFGKDPPIDTQSLFNKVSPHSFGLWLVVAN